MSDAQNNGQLRALVERIERLEAEKAVITHDIKEVYAEAKAYGFDAKILRKVVAYRKREQADLFEEMALIDTYLAALGMQPLAGQPPQPAPSGPPAGPLPTARLGDDGVSPLASSLPPAPVGTTVDLGGGQ